MYFWDASILSFENKKEKDSDKTFVAYKLVIQDSVQSWTTEKRYNDFIALHSKLKDKFSESQLPTLPAKSVFFRTSSDPKSIKERSIGLEKYVRILLKTDSPTCQCGELIDFLDPDKRSSLNNSLPSVAVAPKNAISLLPQTPPRLFILNPESIFLPDGEECFLPQFFDHISESLKYLVQVDNKISTAPSTQGKMNTYELEKERIGSTIATLTEQQKVTTQIIQVLASAHQPSAPPMQNNNYQQQTNYNNFNDYSNIYNNPYTNNNHFNNTNNNNNNNNSNNVSLYPNFNHSISPYHQHPPPPPAYYASPPQQNPPDYYVVVNGRAVAPPPQLRVSGGVMPPPSQLRVSGGVLPPPSQLRVSGGLQNNNNNNNNNNRNNNIEGNTILVSYLETCLRHIQEAIIWESGLEGNILAECVTTSSWCEIQERLKWFESECEKLIVTNVRLVGSLGVSLGKDEKKILKKKIDNLRDQAIRQYLEELTENPKHKCGINPASDAQHIYECKDKMQKTIEFIKENRKRLSGSSPEETVVKYETKMFELLEAIANLENSTNTTSDERKEYNSKSGDIKKKISSLMRRVSEFRVDLQAEMTKIQNHDGDKSNLPDESILHALNNRLEDLQANLADLSHDFSKALEIAQRNTLGGIIKDKQFEDARKVHVQQEDDMFEL